MLDFFFFVVSTKSEKRLVADIRALRETLVITEVLFL